MNRRFFIGNFHSVLIERVRFVGFLDLICVTVRVRSTARRKIIERIDIFDRGLCVLHADTYDVLVKKNSL